MSQHTPGPWELEELEDKEGGNPWYRISGESTLELAVMECSDGYVPGQNKANAHLIAAAPDLLKACHDALAAIHENLRRNRGLAHGLECTALESVSAAIMKAEKGGAL